ncbi:hypothetical protein AQUCO_02800086v1 [Aquilegia coerulea]|uniref:C2H2-type domain-containing protein n=1 Tax=Aquilegia coerulea TaxID=218851 RepID=A0A2G5D3W9_AQUCA|nr:hypothetical protein AQUCO_02800086v1 [Aquilegia coerulea]
MFPCGLPRVQINQVWWGLDLQQRSNDLTAHYFRSSFLVLILLLAMTGFSAKPFRRSVSQYPFLALVRFCHSGSNLLSNSLPKTAGNVALFWDLDNKPPKSIPPFNAAIRLKKAAFSFGFVRYMLAYANHHAFRHVQPVVRDQRKEKKKVIQFENKGVIKSANPNVCRVCGRKFWTNEKLMNHFKLHEHEQMKRLNQLESSRGKRRVQLVAKFSMKMEKYKNAARNVLLPKVGYGLADELKRAGFWVNLVSDKPQAADTALRNRMIELMDKKQAECLVLVTNNSDFTNVLKEARFRCLKTVVVGDNNDGALKRCADASFSWKEIMLGKAKKEAVSVLGRWKDRDVLKRLEWTYRPELEKAKQNLDDSEFEIEDGDIDDIMFDESHDLLKDARPWWELHSDDNDTPTKS